jgi:UDP:flavonoid glycosyltransferase YjiC (YdhE family)
MRILFTTEPLPGHFFPLVPLAWAARASGHDVLVAAPDNFADTVLRAGLPAVSSGPPTEFLDLSPNGSAHPDGLLRYAHGRMFGRIGSVTLPATMSIVERWQPRLVVSERAEFAGPVAAARHGTRSVDLRWGVADLAEYRTAAAEVLGHDLAELGMDGLPEPDLMLTSWPPSLRLPHATDHVGLRHVSYGGTAHLRAWMLEPSARPRICLTLGTLVPKLGLDLLRDELMSVVRDLVRLDFELVVAIDDQTAAAWGPWPAGVRHVGWLPMVQVLSRCALLIHHGGQGTTLTALAAGVPQLVLPQFDDQFENADAVVKAGAGIRLLRPEIVPHTVVGHCLRILETAEFTAAAALVAREIAAQPSPLDVVATLEDLVGEAGA